MGLKKKEHEMRMAGMAYALDIVKEKGIEGLQKECRDRGAVFVPLEISASQIDQVKNLVCDKVIATMLPTLMFCLHDTFGFGKKRLLQFKEAFMQRCKMLYELDPLGGHYETIEDYANELRDKYGLEFDTESIEQVAEENKKDDKNKRYAELDYVLEFLERRGFAEAAEEIRKVM